MEVGRDPYAVFVGGSGLSSDLYAVRPDGGKPIPVTFTNVAELRPALSPDGGSVAFLRGASLDDSTPATIWVMNLLSGSERELALPQGSGRPLALGWASSGQSVTVSARNGLYFIKTPPAAPETRPVPPAERARAESSLAVLLGDPVFARVVPCEATSDLCIASRGGELSVLARGARDPVRWGPDSVAFFMGDNVEIRPLGPGRPRRLAWSSPPAQPREMTFFPGSEK